VGKNSKVMAVAVVAGILLLIAGVNGLATWENIKTFVVENIADNYIIQVIFAILIFIASLGGISVIIGGILIGKEKIRTGKFLISLGAGLGLLGLIFTVIVSLYEGSFTMTTFFSIGAVGLILSIVARLMVKKD
jgi:hypothetical protein